MARTLERPVSEKGVAAGDVNVLDDRDGGTMVEFADPDGNAWVVQQIKRGAERHCCPVELG